jgi:hypothetical protein
MSVQSLNPSQMLEILPMPIFWWLLWPMLTKLGVGGFSPEPSVLRGDFQAALSEVFSIGCLTPCRLT